MSRDEFFRDVRRAVSFMAPRVESDSPFTDSQYIERMLKGTDMWLTQGVVASFRPEDFPELDEKSREDLARAVGDFRSVARAIPQNGPAKPEHRDKALQPFKHIVEVVQRVLRNEWIQASRKLLEEAERWVKEAGWACKRFPKGITEDFIGRYEQDRLVFSAEGAQLALIPVGRFAPGTDGVFDLAVMPAYDSVMVARHGNQWRIHPLQGEEGTQNWSREAFLSTSLKLARLP